MKRVFFISGIDTDIGKTVAAGMLARTLRRRGVAVITQKLVQTGDSGISMDIRMHRQLMGIGLLPEDMDGTTCPEIYSFPASPHLAAELDRRPLALDRIDRATEILLERYDMVLLEGAGGLMAPLTRELLTIDFAAARGYPLILVTCGRLGSLNHTLLSLEAAKSRRIPVVGMIYNHSPAEDPLIGPDTCAYLRDRLRAEHPGAWFAKLGKVDLQHPELTEMTDVGSME